MQSIGTYTLLSKEKETVGTFSHLVIYVHTHIYIYIYYIYIYISAPPATNVAFAGGYLEDKCPLQGTLCQVPC